MEKSTFRIVDEMNSSEELFSKSQYADIGTTESLN